MKINKAFFTSPEAQAMCRESSRATFYHFDSAETARQIFRQYSNHVLLLDGEWEFTYTENPELVDETFASAPDISWEKVNVPDCWVMRDSVPDNPHYTNQVMPFAADSPEVPEKNPTGIYRREFEISDFDSARRYVLHFDGAESCFYVYVNGRFAGASKDSRGASDFNISNFLHKGINTLTVAVIKWSDGTYLEDQDYWYMPGLSRSVYIYDTPARYISDIFARATLLPDLKTGHLELEVTTALAHIDERKDHSVHAGLFLPDGTKCWEADTVYVKNHHFCEAKRVRSLAMTDLPDVPVWSAETPNLCILTLELRDGSGNVIDATAVRCGFRRVEVRDRKLLINGKKVIICGMNRHEHHDTYGRAVPYEFIKLDLMTMKRFNVNAIRTSHYPNVPEFYDLCDELGFYVIDEANIEHHAFENELCQDPMFAGAFIDRAVRLFERDKNHPCIYAWSLGNESGCGANHAAMAGYLRFRDPSRLLHYEGSMRYKRAVDKQLAAANSVDPCWLNDVPDEQFSDFICPMYSHIDTLRQWSEENPERRRPLILCEYNHAMGNSNGGLKDYFHLFRNCDGIQGGFIWEWVDHGIRKYSANGQKYWAYGGDFGDKPNDINFCTDGIVWPDRTPHPGLYEFKYLAQSVEVSLLDAATGRIALKNRRYFTSLDDLDMKWSCEVDGTIHQSGQLSLNGIAPGKSREINLAVDIPPVAPGQLITLNLSFVLNSPVPWAEPGFEAAHESFTLPPANIKPVPAPAAVVTGIRANSIKTIISSGKLAAEIDGDGMKKLEFNGEPLISRGPKLNLWRAALDNDGLKLLASLQEQHPTNRILNTWLCRGLDKYKCVPDRMHSTDEYTECRQLAFLEAFDTDELEFTQRFTPRADGVIVCDMSFIVPESFDDLPRLGVRLELPEQLKQIVYFGRGPHENYSDRAAGAYYGRYTTSPQEMYTPYIMPQENGNRTGVRFAAFRESESGAGLLIVPGNEMQFSALNYSVKSLWLATHTDQLKPDRCIYVNCDLRQRGLGTASCGPAPFADEYIRSGKYNFTLMFKALAPGENETLAAAQVRSFTGNDQN